MQLLGRGTLLHSQQPFVQFVSSYQLTLRAYVIYLISASHSLDVVHLLSHFVNKVCFLQLLGLGAPFGSLQPFVRLVSSHQLTLCAYVIY